MPQKSRQEPDSIHRSQLYNKDSRPGAVGIMYEASETATAAPFLSDPAGMPQPLGSGVNPAISRLWDANRSMVYERDNILRWELTSPFTLIAGPVTTVIPFDNENIHGQGAYANADGWFFSPPPRYSGYYQVGAFLEFLTGAMANMHAARLELWIVSAGATRRWSVLDKQYLEYGEVDDDTYLEKVVLGNNDIVPLCCGQTLTVRLYSSNTGELVMADMASLYGYVHLEYLGCNGETPDPLTQLYQLPNTI